MKKTIIAAALLVSGGAFAQTCTQANVDNAWDNVRVDDPAQMAVVDGALVDGNGACVVEVSSTTDNTQRSRVQDRSPTCENSFRARFEFNVDALPALAANERTKLFNFQCRAADGNSCASVGMAQFRLQGDGAGNNILRSFVADFNQADFRNRFDVPVDAGNNAIEMAWTGSTAGQSNGTFRVWYNGNTNEAAPDFEVTNIDTDGNCVGQVNLGLIAPTNAWTNTRAGDVIQIDDYESRRQSGIGVQ